MVDRSARLTEGDMEVTRKRKRVKKGMKRICGAGVSIMCYRMKNDARPTTVALKNA